MLRRRSAAAALAVLIAALFLLPGAASGAQTQDQALVRVAHFAPALLKGDVYVVYGNGRLPLKGVPFKTVSDYLLLLLAAGGLAGVAGFVVQQRRSTG